jgi:hypothetical protein
MTQGKGTIDMTREMVNTAPPFNNLIDLSNEQLVLVSGGGAQHSCVSEDVYAGNYLLQAH